MNTEIHMLTTLGEEKKAPTSKLQAPEKLQTSNKRRVGFEAWCLEFLWSLDVGAWSFYIFNSSVIRRFHK
jgi:hypothetical protein